jgi:hypothetical protein
VEPLCGTVLIGSSAALRMTVFGHTHRRFQLWWAGGRRTAVRTAGVRVCFTFLCSIVKDRPFHRNGNPSFRGYCTISLISIKQFLIFNSSLLISPLFDWIYGIDLMGLIGLMGYIMAID